MAADLSPSRTLSGKLTNTNAVNPKETTRFKNLIHVPLIQNKEKVKEMKMAFS